MPAPQPKPDEPEQAARPWLEAVPDAADVGRDESTGTTSDSARAEESESCEDPFATVPQPASAEDTARWHEQLTSRIVAHLHAPDLWSHDRPSLAKIHRYARYGEAAPSSGLSRTVTEAHMRFVAVPGTAVLYGGAFLLERPARTGLALLVTVLLVLTLWCALS